MLRNSQHATAAELQCYFVKTTAVPQQIRPLHSRFYANRKKVELQGKRAKRLVL